MLVVALALVAQVDECANLHAPEHHTAGKDVVWEPTPPSAVQRMLTLANVKKGEHVIDLGSGDGRIPIAAARDFGAVGVGVELNHDLVVYARCQAKAQHVDDRVSFVEADLFAFDLTHADVVTTYLLPDMNLCLRPLLLSLKPGTRIAAHRFAMADWEPDVHEVVDGADVFLWIVPARVEGTWHFRDSAHRSFTLELEQSFQVVTGTFENRFLKNATLRGDVLTFEVEGDGGGLHRVEVRVNGDHLDGTVADRDGTFEIHGSRISLSSASGAWLSTAPLCERYRRK
jgi:SAM-dependent methyltransferase